ncbi:MAG: OmpA family protein [Bacteroidota bacterium]
MKQLITLCIAFSALGLHAQSYEILQHSQPINIVELPQLNSEDRECNISLLPNGNSLFFMSHRASSGSSGGSGDIFQSDFVNGAWQAPVALASINTFSGEDEPTFSSDGTEMYYQSWAGNWRSMGGPYYRAEKRNGTWMKTGSMGANINRFFSLQSQANFGFGTDGMAVSADGKLFIVACGPYYNGPMDLYYSVKQQGEWSFPQIMGVSTQGDERSVFIAADNRTIYFSSDGMGGYGGLDIFKVQIEANGKLGEPVNIGAPFNTQEDDMGFVASADGRSAFFIRNLDIYFADISALTEKIKPLDPAPSNTKELPPPLKAEPKPAPITLYFDHDQATPTAEELKKLGDVSQSSVLTLHGYCDSDGNEAYNMDLAKRRCETVKNALIRLGIASELIEIQVHGESNPAATNATEKGKATNRRVIVSVK